jgi:hypothetical protein
VNNDAEETFVTMASGVELDIKFAELDDRERYYERNPHRQESIYINPMHVVAIRSCLRGFNPTACEVYVVNQRAPYIITGEPEDVALVLGRSEANHAIRSPAKRREVSRAKR